uniref:Uncharacterized protein n=1 Tax=Arundo donax TaxID=35708 RepID=A0A0A9TTU8_ARUDO
MIATFILGQFCDHVHQLNHSTAEHCYALQFYSDFLQPVVIFCIFTCNLSL